MNTILLALAALSGLGLALSVVVHVAALVGLAMFGDASFGLHVGALVLMVPTVFIVRSRTREDRPSDAWNAALRDCVPWMRRLTTGSLAYAVLNFVYFFASSAYAIFSIAKGNSQAFPSDASILRGFSGHWMFFYSAAMSVLYSHARSDRSPSPESL